MTLAQFLDVLRRRWPSVLVVTVLATATAIGLSFVQTPQYRASSEVFVSVAAGSSVTDLSQGNNFSAARVKSYTALAVTPRVLGAAAQQLGLPRGTDLSSVVSATSTNDTVIIVVSATSASPTRAAAIANAVTEQLVGVVDEVERSAQKNALVHLSVFQPAHAPSVPYAPRASVTIAVGLLAGLALGLAQAVLREVLDTRLRSFEALRRLSGASVLGEFAVDESVAKHPLVSSEHSYSTRAESFRQLRTHLTYTNLDGASQSIVVTSATPGEGKSSTAVNLALMLAQNGSRVLLVDADLRRPTMGTYLGIESRVGLSTVLTRQVQLDDAVQVVGADNPLHVLAAGRVPPNPSELLSSSRMVDLVRQLEASYDYVIVDAPPILPVTDPAVLGAICSGVLLVASVNGQTKRADFVAAELTLRQVGARVLGLVVNRLPAQRRAKTYYNYEPSAPVSESPRRSSRARRSPEETR
ncbi:MULTISPECIES: polysaccharide biosynthesis tyrosine autokinase [unclassified Curtobacterium]|uniref:polysaccharide biosynthesis tyrosine autokinase n=1 Tax=unclassified Curtobacterium TaxID=257496 RepID=UPI000F4706F5|nr:MULTISPECIES: polysaccharide biosynthesis tyrosine autokinase [unclassified Curtobacterium]ROQ17734.1 capsular exopolysaccharide synthesis family protein [Curtobacterium sp. PhB171]ROQ29021.1 capsular exopolysaccharide synthesis family protein [Curtobacterium sp. PhB170]ROS45835.1 capsular exopolysaccharide synthesis family protein [Curtobacterium sp. PhB131]ROS67863.1 capsular exopolysaccharide synthesis family protein [Curtobacterium sp. PhB141]